MPTFDFICEVCGRPGREHRRDKAPRFCNKGCRKIGMVGQCLKRPKYVITPEMHDRIKSVYQSVTGRGQVNELAREIGLPRWKVSRYAMHQGLIPVQKKEPDWNEKELGILERSAHFSPERIQENLKKAGYRRSCTGILLKRRRMRFLKNIAGHSSRSVAECFGVDDKSVTRWIAKGWLKARRRGTARTEAQGGDHWYIIDKWIRDFCINYVAVIDFRKVDKYWLTDLLAGGNNDGVGPLQVIDGRKPEASGGDEELFHRRGLSASRT